MAQESMSLPAVPVSAGALIFDSEGRLLILKPTYKSGWTIPGGVMGADGESPWEACQREVREETGLEVSQGRLAAMDFRPAKPGRLASIRAATRSSWRRAVMCGDGSATGVPWHFVDIEPASHRGPLHDGRFRKRVFGSAQSCLLPNEQHAGYFTA